MYVGCDLQVVEKALLILMVFVQVLKLQIPLLLNCLHLHLKSCQCHGSLLILKREWDLFGDRLLLHNLI